MDRLHVCWRARYRRRGRWHRRSFAAGESLAERPPSPWGATCWARMLQAVVPPWPVYARNPLKFQRPPKPPVVDADGSTAPATSKKTI